MGQSDQPAHRSPTAHLAFNQFNLCLLSLPRRLFRGNPRLTAAPQFPPVPPRVLSGNSLILPSAICDATANDTVANPSSVPIAPLNAPAPTQGPTLGTLYASVAALARCVSAPFLHYSCLTFVTMIFTIINVSITCAFLPLRMVQFCAYYSPTTSQAPKMPQPPVARTARTEAIFRASSCSLPPVETKPFFGPDGSKFCQPCESRHFFCQVLAIHAGTTMVWNVAVDSSPLERQKATSRQFG